MSRKSPFSVFQIKPVWKTRNIFRFKPGMKTVLLNQVATDNPEGGASSSKGWEVPVQKLIKQGGSMWELLNTRVARENVRQWVEDWNKRNREEEKRFVKYMPHVKFKIVLLARLKKYHVYYAYCLE